MVLCRGIIVRRGCERAQIPRLVAQLLVTSFFTVTAPAEFNLRSCLNLRSLPNPVARAILPLYGWRAQGISQRVVGCHGYWCCGWGGRWCCLFLGWFSGADSGSMSVIA